jgi:raffinose/stachyose/melibiose transport system permease protein
MQKPPQSLLKRIYLNRYLYLFILPTIVLITIFSYYPAFSALYRSLFKWDGAFTAEFIGINNFITMVQDDVMSAAARNLAIVVVFTLFVEVTFPLISAVLLFHLRSKHSAYILRTLLVIPVVVPGIVIILIWKFIYNPSIGLLNQTLELLGLSQYATNWLGNPDTALISVAAIKFPWAGGISFLIYLAGLQNIEKDVFDAAIVDGANWFKRFFRIELPLIMGQVKLLVILTLIGVIQSYQRFLILTEGGPVLSSMVPGLHMYFSAFRYQRFGYGSAIGVVLFVIIFSLTVISRKFIRGGVER